MREPRSAPANADSTRRIEVLLIPPVPWKPSHDRYRAGEAPDPFAVFAAMRADGVNVTLMDPLQRPWNPLFGSNAFYQGFDPLRAAKVLLTKRRIDMVLSAFEASGTLPVLARRLFLFRPKIGIWDIDPDEIWLPRRFVQKLVFPRIDHMFVLGTWQQEYLHERWGIGDRITVVRQHVDADFYRPVGARPGGYVLSIGEDAGRDFDTLLKATQDLDLDLVIKTGRPLPHLAGRTTVRQISRQMSFLELRDLYANAKFVVVPLYSTLNVSGVGSVLEAMAMGKALVTSDNPPLRDYFVDGTTAAVAAVGDVRGLRERIVQMNEQADFREAMGQAGRAMVEREFASAVFGRRMADAIRRVVSPPSPTRTTPS